MDRPAGEQNKVDGGEAILEAFRSLGVEYVISSPGSEWAPVWEALARQQLNGTAGPRYIDCSHEMVAVNMALGYTLVTGRMQAVLLHAGTGLLQGSMGIHGAMVTEVPMLVMSGEALSYGEDPDYEPGTQWHRNLSVVGGPQKLVAPLVKWAGQATSIHTLQHQVVRAGELAQRVPKGATFVCAPMEVMMAQWTPPAVTRKAPPTPKLGPASDDVGRIAALIGNARNPIITTEAAGRDTQAFAALVELAELMAIPIVEGRGATCANFPKSHPLYLGAGGAAHLKQADLILAVASRVPFYPPRSRPQDATLVVISDNPHKAFMVHQNLQADDYLEGDVASSLRALVHALRKEEPRSDLAERRSRWRSAHDAYVADLASSEAKAPRDQAGVDPLVLCHELRTHLPDDAIYIDETVVYGTTLHQHLSWTEPHSFFRTPTGLGQGIGTALGVKLAASRRPVVLLTGDGSFVYGPALAGLGASRANELPVLVVVFNNREYKSMRRNHLDLYPKGLASQTGIHFGNKVDGFDYAGLAALFGGFGATVETAADLQPAIAGALQAVGAGKLAILNVILSR